MILNIRPTDIQAMNTVIQEIDARYTEEQQEDMLAAIVKVLGQPEEGAQREAMERDKEAEIKAQGEGMEVDN